MKECLLTNKKTGEQDVIFANIKEVKKRLDNPRDYLIIERDNVEIEVIKRELVEFVTNSTTDSNFIKSYLIDCINNL